MSEPARETGISVTFLEPALSELAVAQHGPFGLDQLSELGLTESAVRKRHKAGRLHRIHHAVYSLVPRELLSWQGLYMAAVLACRPGAALSYRSAARLHGLRDYGYWKIEVTVPGRSRRKHDGVLVHCSTTLTDKDVTAVENIPVTTVARTLLDLGEVVNQRALERAFDQADSLEVLDGRAINDQLTRNTNPAAAPKRSAAYSPRAPTQTPQARTQARTPQATGLARARGRRAPAGRGAPPHRPSDRRSG